MLALTERSPIHSFLRVKPRTRAALIAALAGALAASCASESEQTNRQRLSGDLQNCANIVELCLQTYPPQCIKTCADEAPSMCGHAGTGGAEGVVEGGEGNPGSGPPDDNSGERIDDNNAQPWGNEIDLPAGIAPNYCGGDPCLYGTSLDGTRVAVCYPPDCAVAVGAPTFPGDEQLHVECNQ